jgi:aminomethyltransferase
MLRTPFYEEHRRLGAKMTNFAGWEAPLFYTQTLSEHKAVRSAAGLFDLSHMGRLLISGRDCIKFLDTLTTNSMKDLPPWRARYTMLCDENGGTIDDTVVFRETEHLWVVPNAVNSLAVLSWMKEHAGRWEVDIADRTSETGMFALQGPRAAEILARCGVPSLDALGRFRLRNDRLFGTTVVLSRTGYTGEDGFEIMGPAEELHRIWAEILDAGKPTGLAPAGLGARDTLRMEAGLALYGHELSRTINPVEAGLSRFIRFKDREFIGKEALLHAAAEENPEARRMVGLELSSQRIARHGQKILSGGRPIGEVTSGTFSPSLEKCVAMGYVPRRLSAAGTRLGVGVSHEEVPATVVAIPFYSRRK